MAGPDATRRKVAAKRQNERIKLFAALLNALAIGTIGAGVIIPATKVPPELTSSNLAWVGFGLVLHFLAQAALALLRSED